eukprot:1187810-Prorocentrum_minimum.AAC.5
MICVFVDHSHPDTSRHYYDGDAMNQKAWYVQTHLIDGLSVGRARDAALGGCWGGGRGGRIAGSGARSPSGPRQRRRRRWIR